MLPVVRDLHFTSHMRLKYIYFRRLSPLLPNGSLIGTNAHRIDQKDKTECSHYLQDTLYLWIYFRVSNILNYT